MESALAAITATLAGIAAATRVGSASFYYYFRNRTLDARDRYAATNSQDVRQQTGGTFGGPIKDKLFFFFNTEVQRRYEPINSSVINSSVSSATHDWIGCGAPATAQQCAAANSVITRMFGVIPRRGDQELYFLKLDYRLNDHNTLSASINYLPLALAQRNPDQQYPDHRLAHWHQRRRYSFRPHR